MLKPTPTYLHHTLNLATPHTSLATPHLYLALLNIPNWAKLRTRSWTPWNGEGVAGPLLRSRAVQLQGIKSSTTRHPCISC